MSDHPIIHRETVSPSSSNVATRSARSSTLPSQQSPPVKHRYRHRPHNSTSHKAGHHYRASTDIVAQHGVSSHSSALSPLGEFLSPVKRNVAEGLSGVAGWIDRDRDRDREREGWRGHTQEEAIERKSILPTRPVLTAGDVATAHKRRVAAEKSSMEQYNTIAVQSLQQHITLGESRNHVLQMFDRLDTTLASLAQLQAATETMLANLTQTSIPELSQNTTKQLENFRITISAIENDRISQLHRRIDTARKSTVGLGDRMARVRSQIKAWEEKELDDDKRRRRRVGIAWGAIGTIVLLVVLLLIWGRMNEELEARHEQAQNWTEIVIEKERNRTDTPGSEIVVEQILRRLHEDDHAKAPVRPLPGENTTTEEDDGLLSTIFDEL